MLGFAVFYCFKGARFLKEVYLIYILLGLALIRGLLTVFPRLMPKENIRKSCNEYLDSFVIAGVVAIVLITYVVRSFYIPSESMVPTLLVNDYILVNKFVYRMSEPMRGDIIVFHPPDPRNPQVPRDTDFIKRVVAVEYDEVVIKDGTLFLNGLPMDEPFINSKPFEDFGPYRVPPGHLFMMGDNRNNSEDSRVWGPLPLEFVVGKAFVIFWPFSRIGTL